MEFGRTNQIRELVRQARAEPGQTARLQALVRSSIPRMHEAIQLPPNNAPAALVDFVWRYVEHVPNFIDALAGLTREAGIHDYAAVFLKIAEDFFLHPPPLVDGREGLEAIMDRAYLAHRLIEEVNDRVVARCGIPLAPMDMTRANLIMHQLIGEPFANDLDFLVHYSSELHLDKQNLMETPAFHRYMHEHRHGGWEAELGRWPCLAEDLSINLAFRDPAGSEEALPEETPLPAAIH